MHPQVESYWGHVNPIGLRSCYDEGKRCAETLFFDYHRQHGLRVKVPRIFNTYGRNPGEFTMMQLAQKVIELAGSKSRIEMRALPSDDPKQRRPDIALARKTLGWEAKTPLGDGLRRTIAYFRGKSG